MDGLDTGLLIWLGVLVLGVFMIWFGARRQNPESSGFSIILQIGYLIAALATIVILTPLFNFNEILVLAVLLSGIVIAVDRWILKKKTGNTPKTTRRDHHLIAYSRSIFPVLLVIFVLRAFVVEPFQIPSSSMRPTLIVGDFILVNKFAYGLRLPFTNQTFIPTGKVERGDIVVFQYPKERDTSFIKRAIGLPGDFVEYRNKNLWINGNLVHETLLGSYRYVDIEEGQRKEFTLARYAESLNEAHEYEVIKMEGVPSVFVDHVDDFEGKENCRYEFDGFVCKIPEGKYLMIGDNRDHSHDGRYWGFVDDNDLMGKAFFIWFSANESGRAGTKLQ